jgi:hypothetical protein
MKVDEGEVVEEGKNNEGVEWRVYRREDDTYDDSAAYTIYMCYDNPPDAAKHAPPANLSGHNTEDLFGEGWVAFVTAPEPDVAAGNATNIPHWLVKERWWKQVIGDAR